MTVRLPGDLYRLSARSATVLSAPADSKLVGVQFLDNFTVDVGGVYTIQGGSTTVTVAFAERLVHPLPNSHKGSLVIYVNNGVVIATPSHAAAPTIRVENGSPAVIAASGQVELPTPRIDGGEMYTKTAGVQAAITALVGMDPTAVAAALVPTTGSIAVALAAAAADPAPTVPGEDAGASALVNAGWKKQAK